jgi:hypothetical protein
MWMASYLMLKGMTFESIDMSTTPGKAGFVFMDGGNGMTALEDEYNSGKAMVNLMLFKATYNHLKGLIKNKRNGG